MPDGKRKSILLVDDEKEVLDTLSVFLRRKGYAISVADCGREALRLAKHEKPDLIILDLILPDIDGSDVAAELLQTPSTRDIPIIFLTCVVTKPEQNEAGVMIANRCIVAKPCKPQEILDIVQDNIGPAV